MILKEYLTRDHKECDRLFVTLENQIYSHLIEESRKSLENFLQRTTRHFLIEEEILFPEFELITGNLMGPTEVMRREHQNMLSLLEDLKKLYEKSVFNDQDIQMAKNILENFLMILQQHNLKEEQILYNMMENVFDEDKKISLLQKIQTQFK